MTVPAPTTADLGRQCPDLDGRPDGGGYAREDGFALIAALAVLVIVLGIVTAAVSQATQVSSKANRDPLVKAALQAADAGAQTALFRINSLANYLTPSASLQCVEAKVDASNNLAGLVQENAVLVAGSSWCPASPMQTIGNGESFSYQMTPIISASVPDPDGLYYQTRRIVATGTASGPRGTLTRRVVRVVRFADPSRLFGDYTLLGQSAVTVKGSAKVGTAVLPAPLRSNKNVTIQLSTGGTQCGNVTYGPAAAGGTFTGTAGVCPPLGQTVTAATRLFPLPVLSPPTSNNNPALAAACAPAVPSAPCTFSATNGNFTLSGSPLAAILTLPPGNYELCSITLGGAATLTINDALGPVEIYIDAPGTNGCTPPSTGAVYIAGTSTLTSTLPSSGTISPNAFQLIVAGLPSSPSTASTAVTLSGAATLTGTAITIVAPYSVVAIEGGSNLIGAALGDTVTAGGNAVVTAYSGLSLSSSVVPLYRGGAYTECTPSPPPSGAAPDQGC